MAKQQSRQIPGKTFDPMGQLPIRAESLAKTGVGERRRPVCSFCGAPIPRGKNGNRSEEHVLRTALLERLGHVKTKIPMYTLSPFAVEKTRTVEAGRMVAGSVCKKCNNEWINDLDVSVELHILSLAAGARLESLDLTHEEKFQLSRWILKTACTFLLTDTAERRHISEEFYREVKSKTFLPRGFMTFVHHVPGSPKQVAIGTFEGWPLDMNENAKAFYGLEHIKFVVQYDSVALGCLFVDWGKIRFDLKEEIHTPLFVSESGDTTYRLLPGATIEGLTPLGQCMCLKNVSARLM